MEGQNRRINSARMNDHIGKTIRLPGKVLRVLEDQVLVESSDGGQVTVKLIRGTTITDDFIEVIGTVLDEQTVRMQQITNLGSNLNMNLVDGVIEMTFLHPQLF